jgi:hypothetical protein
MSKNQGRGQTLSGGDKIPGGNEIWIPGGDGDPFFNREERIPGTGSGDVGVGRDSIVE